VMPLRVIHVVAPAFGYTFSGITKLILRLLREWDEPDIELSLWGTDYLEQSNGRGDSVPLWTSDFRYTRRVRFVWMVRLISMLVRQRNNYDLIHVHTLWWGGLLAPLVSRLLGKKAIYSMTLLGSDTPGALVAQRLGKLKLALFRQYHGVVGLTPSLIDECRQYNLSCALMVLPGYLVFDAPSLTNISTQRINARQQWGIPNNAQVLLFVGSVISRKGVDILIDLFIELATSRNDLWLVVVGAYRHTENSRLDEDFVSRQKVKLERAGLSHRVVWTGLISDEGRLIDLYLASDLFIFPSRVEGQGFVILEAMGCGLPVVCTHLHGVTDVMVSHNKTGYLVGIDDLAGFVSATTRLLDEPELRKRMGVAGRKRVLSDFGFKAYCHNLAGFYQLLFSGKPSSEQPNSVVSSNQSDDYDSVH